MCRPGPADLTCRSLSTEPIYAVAETTDSDYKSPPGHLSDSGDGSASPTDREFHPQPETTDLIRRRFRTKQQTEIAEAAELQRQLEALYGR